MKNVRENKRSYFRLSLISALLCLPIPLLAAILMAVAIGFVAPLACDNCAGEPGVGTEFGGGIAIVTILGAGAILLLCLEIISIISLGVGFGKREQGRIWRWTIIAIALNMIIFLVLSKNLDSYASFTRFLNGLFFECKCYGGF